MDFVRDEVQEFILEVEGKTDFFDGGLEIWVQNTI